MTRQNVQKLQIFAILFSLTHIASTLKSSTQGVKESAPPPPAINTSVH